MTIAGRIVPISEQDAMALLVLLSVILIFLILMDGFEAMIVPRRASRRIRFTRVYYHLSWRLWTRCSRLFRVIKRRENFLSLYGPLSILALVVLWAFGLIVGFGCLLWSLEITLNPPGLDATYTDYLYLSGVTFFTLGYGDLTAATSLGRLVAVVEAGTGFAFLAVVISYLPVLYQAFSKREVTISLLDARAGSPPTAGQLLIRLGSTKNSGPMARMLEEWERWSAELLESHLSYPVLGFYRSQHDNQSWLATLTTILDTSALVISELKTTETYTAKLTFAMARHAAVDLAQHYKTPLENPDRDRLTTLDLAALRTELREAGWELRGDGEQRLIELRGLYEPFLLALGRFFALTIPPLVSNGHPVDNWQTSAWMRRAGGLRSLAQSDPSDDHNEP